MLKSQIKPVATATIASNRPAWPVFPGGPPAPLCASKATASDWTADGSRQRTPSPARHKGGFRAAGDCAQRPSPPQAAPDAHSGLLPGFEGPGGGLHTSCTNSSPTPHFAHVLHNQQVCTRFAQRILRRAPKVTVTREGDSLCQKGCYPLALVFC
jgi:hypothetical protein